VRYLHNLTALGKRIDRILLEGLFSHIASAPRAFEELISQFGLLPALSQKFKVIAVA
jgi:hypothetical protein